MKRICAKFAVLLPIVALCAGCAGNAGNGAAALYSDEIEVKRLFEGTQTILGQELDYPSGKALIVSNHIIVPPGAETGFHTHDYPLYVHILSGKIDVDYGERGVRTYGVGDTFFEAQDWQHNGVNNYGEPVEILTASFEVAE